MPDKLVLGTRASPLAVRQTEEVQRALQRSAGGAGMEFPIETMSVAGDRDKAAPLHQIGGKSLWTKELEVALLEGAVDAVVHSCKDVPTLLPEGCVLGAVLEREDEYDAFVPKRGLPFTSIERLPAGSVVGTSSIRRTAQLKRRFPHLVLRDVRGNLDTRLAKLDDPESPFSAIILACAGLRRLGHESRITQRLRAPVMFPAVGQGALAVECRADDTVLRPLVESLSHTPTLYRIAAERQLLRVLEGGCSMPLGVETRIEETEETEERRETAYMLHLDAVVVSLDGTLCFEKSAHGRVASVEECEDIGASVAKQLVDAGADQIVRDVDKFINK